MAVLHYFYDFFNISLFLTSAMILILCFFFFFKFFSTGLIFSLKKKIANAVFFSKLRGFTKKMSNFVEAYCLSGLAGLYKQRTNVVDIIITKCNNFNRLKGKKAEIVARFKKVNVFLDTETQILLWCFMYLCD